MCFPVSAFHFCEVTGKTVAPPPMVTRRLVKSTSLMLGCIAIAPNSVLTPVKTVRRDFLRVSQKLSISRGLGTSQFSAPMEK